MSDTEYEYEEETSYVTFDMGTNISSAFVEQKANGCRIIGLEEGTPLLQLGGLTFEGKVDETIGTHLLFEIKEKVHDTKGLLPLLTSMRTEDDAPKQQKFSLNYVCSTENIIKMDTVSIKPKVAKETNVMEDEEANFLLK
ncbi:hypothetical protein BD408DRAFT_369832 [Parasitella parasitica]|nr:hypothetical protein BD408DRAFT_369832 [Parasitella parasitica]